MQRICKRCGIEFEVNTPSKLYCGSRDNKVGCSYIHKKEWFNEWRKKWSPEKKEAQLKYTREHYQQNKTVYMRNNRKWKKEHPEEIQICWRRYKEKYRVKVREYHKKYRQYKRANDPQYKIACSLRTRIKAALKTGEISKRIRELTGCSIDEFTKHLESKFLNGMSWENYGKWHIDHIIPCASFDLTKEEEQKKCFHYTNTQPLWAKDNLMKGKKIEVILCK